jgi:hypothetical protein
MLQGTNAHTDNRASKTAPRYTNIAHDTNSAASPTHLSVASSIRIMAHRIVSYNVSLRTL